MKYSPLLYPHSRAGLSAGYILSTKRAVAFTILVLALATGVFVGSPAAQAQDKSATTVASAVNINTADAQTLAMALKGVGDSRAKEIVRHRETHGPFASADELLEVKGIGKSTLDMNRKLITLE